MKYIDKSLIKVGDVFTDGGPGREDVRLMNRAKVLYVDKYILAWFPLNDFTTHFGDFPKQGYKSNTWCLSSYPMKLEIEDLTKEELKMYESSGDFIDWVLN